MLSKLYIKNYAIIREIEIAFHDGLNIITGETGAGKSILMDALGLILGDRASAAALQQEKCVVEGTFGNPDERVLSLLKMWDLDADANELIIRREILPGGKSRAFVNDSPVNLQHLKQLGVLLVDQHRQFDGQELGDESFQREILDAIAGNNALKKSLLDVFNKLTETRKRFKELSEALLHAEKERDYHTFLFEEIASMEFKPGELESLSSELKQLENAAGIREILKSISVAFEEGEQPVVQQLKIVNGHLQSIIEWFPEAAEFATRLESVIIEVADIAYEADRLSGKVVSNPERITQITDRLDTGYRLLKKHQVQDTDGLLRIRQELESKLNALQTTSDSLKSTEEELVKLQAEAEKYSREISKKRKKVLPETVEEINRLLTRVGMPNARLKISILDGVLQEHGTDVIRFLFNANVAGAQEDETRYENLNKVASGGELSRLMLCIKSLAGNRLDLPTMVFDEIDSGISGEATKQVASLMAEMSEQHQIISITHQPQIAAKANAHYYVFKQQEKNTIVTSIRKLQNEERIKAIASMLGGDTPSVAAIENAREMLNM